MGLRNIALNTCVIAEMDLCERQLQCLFCILGISELTMRKLEKMLNTINILNGRINSLKYSKRG